MHPAYSVILFTTASGAGYGLLFWLALAHLAGAAHDTWGFLAGLVLALGLITLGLLSSTFHLGHPERAWRALSQWRSSWLSREGVAALLTYLPAGLFALAALTGAGGAWTLLLAALSALGAVATVWCTGMIYAALRTVREWHMGLVPAVYLALAAASGAVLLWALHAVTGTQAGTEAGALAGREGWLALLALVVAAALKLAYWRRIDRRETRFTAAQALGLGAEGLRPLDPPHSRPNFVMREMGYAVARRHAARLRRIAGLTGVGLPAVLALAAILWGGAAVLAPLAALSMAAGLCIERWLFFAEATHVAMLYYGAPAA